MDAPRIRLLGDAAVVVTFGATLSDEANDRVMQLAASLAAEPLDAAVRDVVPAIASLVVHVDPRQTSVEQVVHALQERVTAPPAVFSRPDARLVDIQTRYGGDDGPDLADVAAFAGITPAEVIERHAARVYRVFMLGFLPGFAYLGQVDPSIAAPRRASPRQSVPAGSVGIAGRQTGVYPQVSPGGWQLIGRTAVRMFDVAAGRALLHPGDRVRFVPERA